jgi:hypothetical protein
MTISFIKKSPMFVANALPYQRYEALQRGFLPGWAMRFMVGKRIVVTARGPLPVHFALLDGDE